jgi:hypothetical protein
MEAKPHAVGGWGGLKLHPDQGPIVAERPFWKDAWESTADSLGEIPLQDE